MDADRLFSETDLHEIHMDFGRECTAHWLLRNPQMHERRERTEGCLLPSLALSDVERDAKIAKKTQAKNLVHLGDRCALCEKPGSSAVRFTDFLLVFAPALAYNMAMDSQATVLCETEKERRLIRCGRQSVASRHVNYHSREQTRQCLVCGTPQDDGRNEYGIPRTQRIYCGIGKTRLCSEGTRV
jgi:hypothetical protein